MDHLFRLQRRALVGALLLACGGAACTATVRGSPADGGTCAAGQVQCGSSCVDAASDVENCGVCGNRCGAGISCCSGACATSCALTVTGLEPARGWMNGGDYVTLRGAGFMRGMRVYLAGGRAPVRVLNASTARIQTPPGPLGLADVRVEVGTASATRADAFRYAAAPLLPPWQQKRLVHVRGEHPGIAVLQDGRVLIAGGTTHPDDASTTQDTAEVFDPTTESLTPVSNTMSSPRWFNSAVTLLDGRVLVVGGACAIYSPMTPCPGNPRAADLFDPASNRFTPTGMPLSVARNWTRAVLLADGRVLIASATDTSLEIYDPESDRFTLARERLLGRHDLGFLVRLRDGRVLIGGSLYYDSQTVAELYLPDSDQVRSAGMLGQGRGWLTAHTLPDGRVVVIGGSARPDQLYHPLDSIEVFDPTTDSFTPAPVQLARARFGQASALVRDGSVLIIGGYDVPHGCMPPADTDTVEQLDLSTGTIIQFPRTVNPITESNAVTLLDGSVLNVGGGGCGTQTALPDLDFLHGGPP